MTEPNKPEAEVISKDAGGRVRVHFAGRLRDAKEYVERNFPRPHVEPGSNADLKADVYVRGADGTFTTYHGEGSGGVDDTGWHDADESGNLSTASASGIEQDSTLDDVDDGTQLPAEQEVVQ